MTESKNCPEVQPMEQPQARRDTLANIKEEALVLIANNLHEFQQDLKDKREPTIIASFDKLNGKLLSFMKEFPSKTHSNRVQQVYSPVIYRIIGLLGLVASKNKTLSETKEEKKLRVFIDMAVKLDAPLGTLINTFRDAPGKWPASDQWKALEGALKELCECVLHLQYDTKTGTCSTFSIF